MKIKKVAATFVVTGLIAYLCTPYYSAWRMMQAVKSGSSEQMQRYIDFPKVQSSIKQQIDTAFEQQAGQDPMAAMMAKMFRPMLEDMVEELLQPEKLAALITSGKLNSQRRTNEMEATTKTGELNNTSKSVSWYAFLDRPTRFRIAVDNMVLYMELQDWQWQMTAIGMDDMLDMNRSGDMPDKELIADEIDDNSPVPPKVSADIDALKADIAEAFFLVHDWGEYVQVEGDFHYSPAMSRIKPTVSWLDARDANNKSVLGQFSKKKQDDREKYHSANQYFEGQWRDELPKLSAADKVVSAKGICRISVPTKMEHYSLNASHLKQMQRQDNSAVTLTDLTNGNVSLSYYTPFDQPKVEPVIIVRNADGQPLKQKGAFSSMPEEPVENPQFTQSMRGTSTSITIAGTPQIIDIYLMYQVVTVENEFTATNKPDVSFGKLETPITQTRYAPPVQEPELKIINVEQLKNDSRVSFHEETNYDKTRKRYIKLTLPDIANSTFAYPDYDDLQISLDGQILDVKNERNHPTGNKHKVYFSEKNEDWGSKVLNFDRAQGELKIRYPGKIETLTIKQGENRNGVHLDGAVLTYATGGDIPDYTSVFDTRSVIAYGENRKFIALLDGSQWDRKMNRLIFWGEPDYVIAKQVSEWIELLIPVDLTIKDLQMDKNNIWGG